MNGATKTAGQADATSGNPLTITQRSLLGLFLIAILFAIAQASGGLRSGINEGLLDGIVVLLALASTVVSLAGQLPAQNVALAATIVAGMGGKRSTGAGP